MTIELAVDAAGVFEPADVHVAQRLTALREETDERVALAVALVVRALRGGSVCVDLKSEEMADLADAVMASPLLQSDPPILRLSGDLLYLDRYWLEEEQVCNDILAMVTTRPAETSPDMDRLFPEGFEEQRAAAELALSQGLTVLTGGPGTGKTTTVARLLAMLASGKRLRIAGEARDFDRVSQALAGQIAGQKLLDQIADWGFGFAHCPGSLRDRKSSTRRSTSGLRDLMACEVGPAAVSRGDVGERRSSLASA